jgi:hypothetical protein
MLTWGCPPRGTNPLLNHRAILSSSYLYQVDSGCMHHQAQPQQSEALKNAEITLQAVFGFQKFRDKQWEAISAALEGRMVKSWQDKKPYHSML